MDMFDWNQNGKNDMGDDFINYQINKDSSNNSNHYSVANNSSSFGIWFFLIALIIIGSICEPLALLIIFGYGWLKLLS